MSSPERSHAWKWWICGLLMLATMINYMDRLTLNQASTRVKRELQLDNEQYGLVESAFSFAFAAGALPGDPFFALRANQAGAAS